MATQDITLDLWHIANQRGNLTNEEIGYPLHARESDLP